MSQTLAGHREVEAVGKAETEDDSHTNGDDGDARRNHTRSYTFNNNGSRTCQTSLRNLLGGLVRMRSVIFGSLTDNDACSKSADDG